MKNKKTLGIIVAMALVAVISVAGTLAYLTKTSGPVTNTFVAEGLTADDDSFKVQESEAVPGENAGEYTLNTEMPVIANEYKVVPGKEIPKDPYALIKKGELKQKAYLFIEVVDETGDKLTWTLDSAWTKIEGVTGRNGGEVYTYGIVSPSAPDATEDQKFNIIDGEEVEIGTEFDEIDGTKNLEFYGYLSQATGFDTAKAAWEACFAPE